MNGREKHLVDLLQAKRHEDPEGFRRFLPEVAELLPEPPTRRSRLRSTFGLTERERSFHRAGVAEALAKLEGGAITADGAAKGLQHCANLIRDDVFTDEVDYETSRLLVKAALGKSPGSYKSKTTVPMGIGGGEALEQVAVLRGVYLDLDSEMRLVSISINPAKVREWKKLMAIVGIGKDPERDVALRHDDYLAMQDPHGNG